MKNKKQTNKEKMNKKGVALEVTLKFIVGIVFLVLIVFALVQTGLLNAFKEQSVVMLCTFSSVSRNTLIQVIWSIAQITIIAATVFTTIAGGAKGASTMKFSYLSKLKTVAEANVGEQVAVSIQGPTAGRNIKSDDIMLVDLPEKDAIKIQQMRKFFSPSVLETLEQVIEIKRKFESRFWALPP